jgi:hypothetical protein
MATHPEGPEGPAALHVANQVRSLFAAERPKLRAELRETIRKDTVHTVQKTVAKAIAASFEDPCMRTIIDVPMMAPTTAAPERVDDEQLFQLFAIYCGDVRRCALAANMDEATVQAKAEAGGWVEKIKLLIDLKASARPGDSERGINRAVNFVQAHRWRNHLQRVMNRLMAMDDEELFDMLCSVTVDKAGNIAKKLNTRAFADLSSAMEKCHAMSYSALNDTVGERKERGDEPEQHKTAAEMHLNITRAMEQIRLANAAEQAKQVAVSSTVVEDILPT